MKRIALALFVATMFAIPSQADACHRHPIKERCHRHPIIQKIAQCVKERCQAHRAHKAKHAAKSKGCGC